MSGKKKDNLLVKLTPINKQMTILKKKIQLSEGQRKALFEVCENEKKSNVEKISQLKNDIGQLVIQLRDCLSVTSNLNIQNKKLESIIGPFSNKTIDEIQNLLDLQIIDKNKNIDLIHYKIKKQKNYLTQLGKEYQILVSEENKKQVNEKVDKPIKKTIWELQNNIHAVEVQIREAIHIRNRYNEIKKSLEEDAVKFESNIKELEDELQLQKSETERLQKVMVEAIRMKSIARQHLIREEKLAVSSAGTRERQTAEGKRLVETRKKELEQLEKHIFQRGKNMLRTEPDGADDGILTNDEESSPKVPIQNPEDELIESFKILKTATGGTNNEEILDRFTTQKDTYIRLIVLRKTSESEKYKLENRLDELNKELEQYKYAQVRDAERKLIQVEEIQQEIEKEKEKSRQFVEKKENIMKTIKSIQTILQGIYTCINPLAIPEKDILPLLEKIDSELNQVLEKNEQQPIDVTTIGEEDTVFTDEKWLPAPYTGLIRKTPQPQQGSSPAPLSEDEEEVPSRNYLKRQAQLVIDLKSRRKNVRMQLAKN